MENSDFLKRAEDLRNRCEKRGIVTHTGFLTPAESYEISNWAKNRPDCRLLLHGGHESCERVVAFFLAEYIEAEYFDAGEYICAIELTAHFGAPGHRDYMGALLGMGIGREWLGDIWVRENEAVVFCLESVCRHLLSIEKVGRYAVKTKALSLEDVSEPERKVKVISFSVMSMRLDAVAAGMFSLSRSECARHIAAGNVSLNYAQCFKPDAAVKAGDIISIKGEGKGNVGGTGGISRKGRLFVNAEIYK